MTERPNWLQNHSVCKQTLLAQSLRNLAQTNKPAQRPKKLQNAAVAVKHDDNLVQLPHVCLDSLAVWHDATNAQNFWADSLRLPFGNITTWQHMCLGLALRLNLEKHLQLTLYIFLWQASSPITSAVAVQHRKHEVISRPSS